MARAALGVGPESQAAGRVTCKFVSRDRALALQNKTASATLYYFISKPGAGNSITGTPRLSGLGLPGPTDLCTVWGYMDISDVLLKKDGMIGTNRAGLEGWL
eukprot:767597-Hanusia_phi.AAC.3